MFQLVLHVFLVLMNFFFLDRDPKKCARYHGDKHLNKMQVESAQICSLVWYRLVFDPLADGGGEIAGVENIDFYKSQMYKRTKSHMNHPVVKWAAQSLAHYRAIVDLGLALCDEKRRRIQAMDALPVAQRKSWKWENECEKVLKFLQEHPPPSFPDGDSWTDPPKCMPPYLHQDGNGKPLSVVDSYRLFYAGNKVTITHLRWEPHVEVPDFLAECQAYIQTRPDIVQGIQDDWQKTLEKQQTKRRKVAFIDNLAN